MARLDPTLALDENTNRLESTASQLHELIKTIEDAFSSPIIPDIDPEISSLTLKKTAELNYLITNLCEQNVRLNSVLNCPHINANEAEELFASINQAGIEITRIIAQLWLDHSNGAFRAYVRSDDTRTAESFDRLYELSHSLQELCQTITATGRTITENDQYCSYSPSPNGFFPPCPSEAPGCSDMEYEPEPDEYDFMLPESKIPETKPSANTTLSAPPMPIPQTGTPKKVKPVRVDAVSFSVLSPERVKKGEYSTVDVYMYTKSQRRIIEKAIKAASQKLSETEKSGFRVSRGSEVKVILRSDDVEITEDVDTRIWDGECSHFDFQFFVPQDYSKKQIAFTCYVQFNGIQITRLHFSVGLSSNSRQIPVKVKRKDHKKAFVSYSHKDEKRVLAQLVAITEVAPQMVFWLDSQSLESGDVWRKEIQRAIRNADVFLLFWSVFARQSEEVRKEWTYALKKKGLRFIAPVPLDPPTVCPPPQELDDLHFGRSDFSYSDEMDSLTFASSKQFRRIK